jgi:hypothetical protein
MAADHRIGQVHVCDFGLQLAAMALADPATHHLARSALPQSGFVLWPDSADFCTAEIRQLSGVSTTSRKNYASNLIILPTRGEWTRSADLLM